MVLLASSCSQPQPILKIGLVADSQNSKKATAGKRYHKESTWKLEEAIDTFIQYGVDFIQTLGDVIDDNWESYDSILPIYKKLASGIESNQLLGHHDFSIDSSHMVELLTRLSMPNYN